MCPPLRLIARLSKFISSPSYICTPQAGESTKRLSGSRVLELIFHYFPELPANTLRKQLKWVLPSGLYNDLSRDNFRVFLSINQAGSEKARIHMNNLKSALTGQDTVLGR